MPDPQYAPRLRPERLIAAGRIVLAVSSLFAVWLDPGEPVRYPEIAYGLLVAYVIYAGAVAAIVWRVEAVPRLLPVVVHSTDLVCFSLFIFFTEGPSSPFTVYFVFALLVATLRWQARGTLWTALVVLAAFFGFGVYFNVGLQDPDFDMRALIIRGVYMVVVAGLLGYVGAQDLRTLREMWRLAAWPHAVHRDAESLVRDLLGYAGPLLDAPRVGLAWAEPDTPWRVAVWGRRTWTHERLPADARIVDDAMKGRAFICGGPPDRPNMVLEPGASDLSVWHGRALEPEFAWRFAPGTALVLPLRGESFDGHLFCLDKPDPTLDDLVLAEIVAGVIAARLEAFYLAQHLHQAAATEERIRLARDLHDGVLQSFTGIALRLAAIRRMMDDDRQAAIQSLEDAQRVLASEQRDVRFFIQELKPTSHATGETTFGERLMELTQRMEREWDLRVELNVDAPSERMLTTAPLSRDVYHIVREALVNAARHGAASTARVAIAEAGDHAVRVCIGDNGRGFTFSGRYSGEELAGLDLGPKTLRERVRAMNGSLVLASSASGAELDIVIPIPSVS